MLVKSLDELLNEAEKHDITVCIEGARPHTVSTPEIMNKLLERLKSEKLRVLFAPVNLITVNNHENQQELIKKSFEFFGDKISVIHLKDFFIDNERILTTFPGGGSLDFEFLFERIEKYMPGLELIVEDIPSGTMDKTIKFIDTMVKRHN